ncbi:MAG: DUF4367 domain-containing protein [bacterium]|nr:DUF4367 domain-containing protein [bacterium]
MHIASRSSVALLAAIVAFAPIARANASGSPPPADQLLRRAMTAPRHVSYVGEVQVLRIGEEKSEAAIFRIEHLAPDLTRRWYLAPQRFYGDSVISRGEKTYSIDVKRDRVIVAQDDSIDDQVAEDDNFSVLMANYTAEYAPDETVEGRPVHVVILNNKYTGETTMRVRIDAKTDLVVGKEIYGSDGSLVAQTRFEQLRYTANIPRQIFDVPQDLAHVAGPARSLPSIDLQHVVGSAGFKAMGPKYLPEGFTPIEGDVTDVKGVRTLHLLYSDGIRTVSLFQNKQNAAVDLSRYRISETKIDGQSARYVTDGPTTLLTWSEAGLHFTLVGDLTLAELGKIASSVVP